MLSCSILFCEGLCFVDRSTCVASRVGLTSEAEGSGIGAWLIPLEALLAPARALQLR